MPDKKKVVIIDDEQDLCLMMKDTLERTGQFEVVTTSNPLEAENIIRQAAPDIILTDIVMPKRKGPEIIAALQKDPALKRIPIVVVSGKGEMIFDKKKKEFKWTPNNPMVKERGQLPDAKSAEALSEAYKVSDYISKPFTADILLQVVNDVIEKYKKRTDTGSQDDLI